MSLHAKSCGRKPRRDCQEGSEDRGRDSAETAEGPQVTRIGAAHPKSYSRRRSWPASSAARAIKTWISSGVRGFGSSGRGAKTRVALYSRKGERAEKG